MLNDQFLLCSLSSLEWDVLAKKVKPEAPLPRHEKRSECQAFHHVLNNIGMARLESILAHS